MAQKSQPLEFSVPITIKPEITSINREKTSSPTPLKVINTLEHQMQQNTDPKIPRGEPQLVGLTRIRYEPASLQQIEEKIDIRKNYILDCLANFYPDKPTSKRITRMRKQSKLLATSDQLCYKVKLTLPYPILIEQLNFRVVNHGKKQSSFSQTFQLVTIQTEREELLLKSAFSECVTRNGKIEYNLTGVCRTLTLVFAKDWTTSNVSQPVEIDQIKLKMNAESIELEDRIIAQGNMQSLINDDEDDFRILDSLPSDILSKQERVFNQLLSSIEIVGFNLMTVPAITNLTYFMNQSFYLKNRDRAYESEQVDLLSSQLLVTTKRATQAAEMYRQLQQKIIKGSHNNQLTQLVDCALLELLIADSMPADIQLNEKLYSIKRLACFLRGEVPSDINQRFQTTIQSTSSDAFSSIMINLSECLRFIILCLSHRMEIVKMSALKLLKFVLETQGCSLDFALVFTLKAMLNIYPSQQGPSKWTSTNDFDIKQLIGKDICVTEYVFNKKQKETSQQLVDSAWIQIDEPQSGFKRAITSVYQHVLDTVISVLSSVSSHILHAIFYDVIEPTLMKESQAPLEVRVFTCKIAEKIFTICQGDLILKPTMLDNILVLLCNQKALLPDSIEATSHNQIKNLWQSIRQKVFPNYSAAGYRSLTKWLINRLTDLKGLDQQDELIRQLAEVITIIATGRLKNEEESQQLIRLPSTEQFGGGPSSEFYLLLPPLLYWMEYSIEKEERLPLFQQIYQTIKDVLMGLAPGQCDLELSDIIMPSLQLTSNYLKGNSPNLSMLKFLDLVLTDFQKCYIRQQKASVPFEVQYFFLELMQNFVTYISYSLYEDVFSVFEKLLSLCSDVLTEKIIKSCLVALVDKYTMKSKALKTTVQNFMKFLLDTGSKTSLVRPPILRDPISEDMAYADSAIDSSLSQRLNYFETMSEFCFFNNNPQQIGQNKLKQLEFRSQQDLHDLFIENLNFFVESLSLMSEGHINVFTNLITHPSFKQVLLSLIASNETYVRLKAHEIIESLSQFFVQFCPSKTVYEFASGAAGQNQVMDAEFISHERLYISQIVIAVAKASLERTNDCYLQFNSLILLDFLFQNLLPVPTFLNEQLKIKKQKEPKQDFEQFQYNSELTLDVEVLSISEATPELDVMDPIYLRMRMKLVVNLWSHIQSALNSPWSNIRSICYGLICSMLKVDVADYPQEEAEKISPHLSYDEIDSVHVTQQRLSQIVLPMLYQLLSSKESESKAGGLNILGSFCGLSYDFTKVKIHKHLSFFQRNSAFVSLQIWQLVFNLQDDWDITIKEASVVLVQLCAPRNAILYFQSLKLKKEHSQLSYLHAMQKVTDIYSNKKLPEALLATNVRSECARRAMSLFPSEEDRERVLGSENIEHHPAIEVNMGALMLDRQSEFHTSLIPSSEIIAMSQTLQLLVQDFNPNYEDKRFTQVQQPLSRRRQMEIELNMNSRSKEAPGPEADPNFFVDKYSDDQIQEIVSIFRNDFKPPKNLWIEKQPNQIGGQSQGNYGQVATSSQSPDFFQEIYSEAIEQFNQYQMMMQQKQQDELQQQVSSGLSNMSLSQSSVNSNDSVLEQETLPPKIEQRNQKKDGSDSSSTPSPNLIKSSQIEVQQVAVNHVQHAADTLSIQVQNHNKLEMPIGVGPTSPVLASSQEKYNFLGQVALQLETKKRASLKIEKLNLEQIQILGELPSANLNQKVERENQQQKPGQPKEVKPIENDQMQPPHNQYDQSASLQLKVPRQMATERTNLAAAFNNSNSVPEFNLTNQRSPKNENRLRESVDHSSGLGVSGEHTISRKMAHTYFQGLSQGYIQNIDNLKLIKTCLNQQNSQNFISSQDQKLSARNMPTNINLMPQQKLTIKTGANQAMLDNQLVKSLNYGSTKSQKTKKATLSNNSPDTTHAIERTGLRKSSKFGKKKSVGQHQEKEPKVNIHNRTSQKQMNNLADLNFFIKYIEKDLNKKFKSMKEINQMPTTPSNIIKKVEDQMRVLGVDPKFWINAEQTEVRRSEKAPPQMKLLALNQIVKNDENNYTPSNLSLGNGRTHKTSSPKQRNSERRSDDRGSDSEFSKTLRLDKKGGYALQGINITDKLRTHRESESNERKLEVNQMDRLSSGRAASNNSTGNSYCQPILSGQTALLTDRSSQNANRQLFMKSLDNQKQANSTRYDSGQQFQFKKGASKSQQKGYGALAGKPILSPQLKRDQQSGGIMSAQMNVQNQVQTAKNSQTNFKKSKASFQGKITQNNMQEIIAGNVESIKSLQTQRINSGKAPQSTRNLEQGDRKQFSPDSSSIGKPPLKKKKQGHSFTSNGVQKPSLVLQNPSYY